MNKKIFRVVFTAFVLVFILSLGIKAHALQGNFYSVGYYLQGNLLSGHLQVFFIIPHSAWKTEKKVSC